MPKSVTSSNRVGPISGRIIGMLIAVDQIYRDGIQVTTCMSQPAFKDIGMADSGWRTELSSNDGEKPITCIVL